MHSSSFRRAAAALWLATVAAWPRAAVAHVDPLTEEELAALSPHVVVAVVEGAAPSSPKKSR